jgi:hypothetical protein
MTQRRPGGIGAATVAPDRTDSAGGYIRLWRRLIENPVWTQLSPAVLKVMIGFLLKANWKPATWYDGSAEVEIPRGSFVTSYPKMAQFCNLTPKQTRLAFDHLQRMGFAAYRRAPRWTLVTILNYCGYQDCCSDEGTVQGGLRARRGQDEGTMRAPIEEGNKGRSKNICASQPDARLRELPPIDNPPFETTEPDALFPAEPRSARPKPDPLVSQQTAWFAEWWAIYWRRRDRKNAQRAFRAAVQTETRFRQVMAATKAQTSEMLAREDSKRPHGATWLRGERWDDELTPPAARRSRPDDDYPVYEEQCA